MELASIRIAEFNAMIKIKGESHEMANFAVNLIFLRLKLPVKDIGLEDNGR